MERARLAPEAAARVRGSAQGLVEAVRARGASGGGMQSFLREYDLRHVGRDASLLVNAGTRGMMLTGRLVGIDPDAALHPASWFQRLIARAGEP